MFGILLSRNSPVLCGFGSMSKKIFYSFLNECDFHKKAPKGLVLYRRVFNAPPKWEKVIHSQMPKWGRIENSFSLILLQLLLVNSFEACILDQQHSVKAGLRQRVVRCHIPNEKIHDAIKLLPCSSKKNIFSQHEYRGLRLVLLAEVCFRRKPEPGHKANNY